jgi:hypothetical protein
MTTKTKPKTKKHRKHIIIGNNELALIKRALQRQLV